MIINPLWQPPCSCEACVVANVSKRPRPWAGLHGRDLQHWWTNYERFQFEARRAMRTMPKAEPIQTDPEGRGL
jgi:hypothetical protein